MSIFNCLSLSQAHTLTDLTRYSLSLPPAIYFQLLSISLSLYLSLSLSLSLSLTHTHFLQQQFLIFQVSTRSIESFLGAIFVSLFQFQTLSLSLYPIDPLSLSQYKSTLPLSVHNRYINTLSLTLFLTLTQHSQKHSVYHLSLNTQPISLSFSNRFFFTILNNNDRMTP